jgi:hypothetical protein
MKNPSKVMVWGCFSSHGRGSLHFVPLKETINAERYKRLLEDKLLITMRLHGCRVFQQDSAPAHTAKIVSSWLKDNNIQVLEWPGNSPDLNPIENLWVILKRKVAARAPSNMQDLIYWIKRAWCQEITQELYQNLIHSMPKRVQAVISHKGAATKY